MFPFEDFVYNSSGRQQICPEHGYHLVKLKAKFLGRAFPPCLMHTSNIVKKPVSSGFRSLQTQP